MSLKSGDDYNFGAYRLDPASRMLTRSGEPVVLPPKTFDLLLLLVENQGRLVSKTELMDRLWGDAFVEEGNLTYQISVLRKALGRDGAGWIETAPKHGYRFVPPVEAPRPQPALAPARPRPVLVWTVPLAAIGAAIFGWVLWSSRTSPPRPTGPWKTTHVTSYPGREGRPSLSPDGSQVAFTWSDPKAPNRDVYIKLVEAGDPIRLTSNAAPDLSPEWSPDGKWIAFARVTSGTTSEILVIPSLGGAERSLGNACFVGELETAVSWTPDSRWLAVPTLCSAGVPLGLDLVSLETAERRPLTRESIAGAYHYHPSVSPDGKWLAFTERGRTLKVIGLGAEFEVSGNARTLPIGEPGVVVLPAWTPDSRDLVFAKYEGSIMTLLRMPADGRSAPEPVNIASTDALGASIARNGRRMVLTERIIDTNVWRVPLKRDDAAAPFLVSSRRDEMADYSPDGAKVVWMSARDGRSAIWIANADGSHPYPLVRNHQHVGSPRWSPDGRSIAFDSDLKGFGSVYVISVSGGTPRRVTTDDADSRVPSWSVDGKWIYFGSDRGGSVEIWKQPVAGGPAVQVTKAGGGQAFESPDGRWLFYTRRPDRGLWKMPVSGGPETRVAEGGGFLRTFAGRDGVYFLEGNPGGFEVHLLPYDANASKVIASVQGTFGVGIGVSPDGEYLAFTRRDAEAGDILMVDGYQ